MRFPDMESLVDQTFFRNIRGTITARIDRDENCIIVNHSKLGKFVLSHVVAKAKHIVIEERSDLIWILDDQDESI